MDKIRVLHIIWSSNIGGIEKLVFDLTKSQLQNTKLSAEVLVCGSGGIYIDRFRRANINCHLLGMKGAVNFSFAKAGFLKKLFKEFDILHFHSFNAWVATQAIASHKKIFFTEHGNFAFSRKRKLSEIINVSILKIFLNNYVNFISFNSKFSEATAKERYGLKGGQREVIPNGIDLGTSRETDASFIPERVLGSVSGKFVVGTCSRFVAFKKIDRLIRVFSEFSRDKNDVVLLLCGDGSLKKDYEKLVQELGLSEIAIFTGYSNHPLAMQQCMDVTVYPSLQEPFGLVAVESFSLGKPVLVFADGGGLTEIVSGMMPDDVVSDMEHMRERMTYYYDNREQISSLKESRIQYARRYDVKVMEEHFFNRYKKLMK